MKIMELLDELKELVEQSPNVIFSHKKAIDYDIIMDILDDLYQALPEDMQEAKLLLEQKNMILSEAQEDADQVRQSAEVKINEMTEHSDITQMAYEKSREILESAQQSAKEIRLGARDYADEVLADIEKYIKEYLEVIAENRQELKGRKKAVSE